MLKRLLLTASIAALMAAPAAAQSLTMLASAGGSGNTFAAAAQHFTEQTGIPVEVIQYPYAEVREKQLLELIGNTGAFDVINIDGSIWLPEVGDFLLPIDESAVDTSHLITSMVDLFRNEEGELIALPIRIAGWVLIYRTDLFEEAGLEPPTTWSEFRAAAEALTGDGVYGVAPALRQGNYLTTQWIPFLLGHGGSILNEDRTAAAFNTPEGIRATQFFVDLVADGLVPPGAAAYEQSDIITAMSQGIAAMALAYSPYYLNINDPETSVVTGNVAIAPFIPHDDEAGMTESSTLISGWGWGVPSSSRNPELALQFIEFVASEEEQLRLAIENNNAPTAAAVYESEEYLAVYEEAPNVLAALARAEDRPLVESWTVIEDILARELSSAITGAKSVEQALADAEAAVNAQL